MPFRFVSISHCRSTIGRRIGQDAAGAQQRAGECPEEASDHHRGSGPGDRGEFKRALVVLCFKDVKEMTMRCYPERSLVL